MWLSALKPNPKEATSDQDYKNLPRDGVIVNRVAKYAGSRNKFPLMVT